MSTTGNSIFAIGASTLLVLALSACGADDSAAGDNGRDGAAGNGDPGLEELVAAAQEEGSLTLYGVPDEHVLRTVGQAFTELYDVDVETVRLVSADLSQRFSSEAASGRPATDAILLTYSPFFSEALAEEWLIPLTEADIPDYPAGYPGEYLVEDGDIPLVSLVLTSMVYNTGEVGSEPTSWEEYANPDHQGRLAIADPATSPANLAFWQLMREEYGDDFLSGVGENEPTWHNSAVPGTQAVAAGESVLGHPGVQAIVDNLQEAGAPIEAVTPGPTTGPEIALGLAAGSANPNAARLFAHYLLSEEGSTLLAEASGAGSPYGAGLGQFIRPQPVSDEDRDAIVELLGSE